MPQYDIPVGVEIPETVEYDETTRIIKLGKGQWSNVSPAVWDYTVGGRNVIDSWVGYRRAKPKGRKSSPLDQINEVSWTPELSQEFSELLAVLTHLVSMEPQQAELLEQIMRTELITNADLQAQGVSFSVTNADRKPRLQEEAKTIF
ncbi:hypothetical protein BM477_06790 [Boudabousia marimammalium]|uniref:Type ISP restriction-modification enzyme LLaBIII C-terminal specificity domain-containing protein n=2 Tax=Boudabousia marimammalium TaxID=156892 RepID=A0A1Q5PL61_9ACTO|nr:hypothetical protein BM477_06790 [Boudabousia marimammalium]